MREFGLFKGSEQHLRQGYERQGESITPLHLELGVWIDYPNVGVRYGITDESKRSSPDKQQNV